MKAIKYAKAICAAAMGFAGAMSESMSAHFQTMKRLDDIDKRHIKSLKDATETLQKMGYGNASPPRAGFLG